MVPMKGKKPKYESKLVMFGDVQKRLTTDEHDTPAWKAKCAAFLKFLSELDVMRTEIYHVEDHGTSSGRTGFEVLHWSIPVPPVKAEHGWANDVAFRTWFGLSAWMS